MVEGANIASMLGGQRFGCSMRKRLNGACLCHTGSICTEAAVNGIQPRNRAVRCELPQSAQRRRAASAATD